MDTWARARAPDVAVLVADALPDEHLTAAELEACCWSGDSVVLATSGEEGVVAVSVADEGERRIGFVKLLAVRRTSRRAGHGRALVLAAQEWAFANDAAEVRVGAAPPFYLWPGCDVEHLEALCLFESLGYWTVGAELNMRCDTTFRSNPPAGTRVDRVRERNQIEAVLTLVRREWPNWEAETARGIESATCFAAFDAQDPSTALGYASHSVNRQGWIGPMATHTHGRHAGIGSALLGALCKDLQAHGLNNAEIAWVGPVGFYAKAASAKVSRVYRSLTLPRPAAARAADGTR